MTALTLQTAIADLYKKVRVDRKPTSTQRLRVLADFCVQEFAARGLAGAVVDPAIPGFARAKDWDVVWFHRDKARLAISLKSILENLAGTVPNRGDDLMGEAANLQMYAPETVIGYVMIFNAEEDEFSKKHGATWGDLLRGRLHSIAGRRPPHWTIGTVEAVAFVTINFKNGPKIVSGGDSMPGFFDTLVQQVFARNPDLAKSTR